MRNSRGFKNLIITALCQLSMLVFGIILPKITIMNLGSEANGFLSTINEVFSYVALIEGGLGLALLNSLYGPISKGNDDEISDVMTAARIKYRRVALAYFAISIIIALLFPFFLKTRLSYKEMALAILLQGIGGAGTMYLSSSICQYLIAAGRNYIKEINHLACYVLTSISKIALIIFTKNIVVVTLIYTVFCLIEGSIYQYYFIKHFPEINLKSDTPKYKNLSEQKYFLVHQISSVIFSATDLFVISIFCSLTESSIYAVYSLVFTAISTIMLSVFNSMKYILGAAYADGLAKYTRIHDIFDTIYLAVMFSLYFTAFLLANGFVGLYTRGADVNYVDTYLPMLFALTKILSSCRNVCGNTHNIAHRAKQNMVPTVVEAILNLGVSLILVNFLGMYGVLIGTVAALVFRTNQTIIYTNRFILHRSSWYTYKNIIAFTAVAAVLYVIIKGIVTIDFSGYLGFAMYLFIIFPIVFVLYMITAILISKDVRNIVKSYIV